MNKRLQQMIDENKIPNKGGVFIDAYNQSINKDIAGTITTRVDASNMNFITDNMEEVKVEQIGNLYPDKEGFKNRTSGRVYSADGLSPTLRTVTGGHNEPKITEQQYRIRKLTPCECFRLIDVSESDIDKIQASGVSNSQQYKLAGNSIVVSCLYHLFRKMFAEPENEQEQLTLF